MVSVLKSMVLAIQLAKKTRDGLAAQLKRCKQSMANAQGQMGQLTSYADETHEKWIAASQVGVNPEIMHHHVQFMTRLQEAIALQQSVINNIDADTQRAHKNFIGSQVRLASLEHMQKKLQSNLDVRQGRREQKQTDEFAALKRAASF